MIEELEVIAAGRDGMDWAVDIATLVVGLATVVALAVAVVALRRDHRESRTTWLRQIALDHHARIYAASATLNASLVAFARAATDRIQARGTAAVDFQADPDADESVDPHYAKLISQLGGSLTDLSRAHDAACLAIEELWFLIPREGDGEQLLRDLGLVRTVLAATRPRWNYDTGAVSIDDAIDSSGLRHLLEFHVDTVDLDARHQMRRATFLRDLTTKYLTGRIGQLVPPPPLAGPTVQ